MPNLPRSANPWHDVFPGNEARNGMFDAIIEIPLGSTNKYELDKESGLLRLDRVLHSAVYYPANYGFIPQTLADDGDPLDVLVLSSDSVHPLTIVTARAIGLMGMLDNDREDDKIIAIAMDDPDYADYLDIQDLPPHRLNVIRRFFQDYKTLENKRVIVDEIQPARDAPPVIERSLMKYRRWKAEKERDGRVAIRSFNDISDDSTDDRLENAVPPAGENLSSEQRKQMEKKGDAEHEERREKLLDKAEKRDAH